MRESFFRNKNIDLNLGLSLIGKDTRQEIGGYMVKVGSLRLRTFKELSCDCIECGRKGTHFRIQGNEDRNPHMGLWSNDGIEMTKDHIIPKSFGGFDVIENMQTMCVRCNNRKGNKFTEEDFNKGAGSLSYEEALEMKKNIYPEETLDINFRRIGKGEMKRFFFYLLSKDSKMNEIYLKFNQFKGELKRDPFSHSEFKEDIVYALSFLQKILIETSGYIPKKSSVSFFFPKKIIAAEKALYSKEN